MPQLKNARHEEFCQQVVKGKSQTDAYIAAGYKPNQGNSSVLAARPEIKGRINEIKSIGAKEAAFTVETAIREYEEARALAMSIEQPASMVAATTGKCKVAGLLSEHHVVEGGDSPIKYEVTGAADEVIGRIAGIASRVGTEEGTRRPH